MLVFFLTCILHQSKHHMQGLNSKEIKFKVKNESIVIVRMAVENLGFKKSWDEHV